MTDNQKSLVGYKSKVHEQGEFENPNDGKRVLNEDDEYILRLTKFPHVKTFQQIKEKKDGSRVTINVDKAICEFEETETKNIVTAFFRVDSLNFSEDEAFQSAIVRFFRKIGLPLTEGIEPVWEEKFIVGMRFRARVVVGKDKDKKPDGKYYLDIPTCRKLPTGEPAQPAAPSGLLANALLIAKGAKSHQEAMDKLQSAGTSKEIVMTLFQAHLEGKITYPI